jgi:hypothetical protein
MIWFACKQCGKRHGRAENLSGMLVFCECGQGNRVPWSSTAPEPEPEEALPALPPRSRDPEAPIEDEQSEPKFPQPRRTRESRRPNPAYCLNHGETPKDKTCDACHYSFCSACVVTLQGATLCGPCKNFRIRSLSRPVHPSPLSIIAFVLALICAPVSLVLGVMAIASETVAEVGTWPAVLFCLLALALTASVLIVGWLALWQIERKPHLSGRALAMTGVTTGLTGVVWSVAIAMFSIAKQWQG